MKVCDDGELKQKDCTDPHGNDHSIKKQLMSDCSQCAPTGVRIILWVAMLKKWIILKVDVNSASLQTGRSGSDV